MARPEIMLTPGERFGRWTVLEYAGKISNTTWNDRLWKCRCDCGTEGIVRQNALRSGQSQSCGCRALEARRRRRKVTADV